jgi:biopolymer transport protein ExbD
MAMQLGAQGGADEPIMDINTTPLIDVMLVLLVMLIITIPIQLHSVNLQLPTGTPPVSDAKPEVVTIEIDDHSRVVWNGEPLADRPALQARLAAASAQAVQPELHVRPNAHAKYDTFAEVMVSANQAGLKKLGVLGHEQFIDR